jgi:hypothetical protein
VIQILFIGEGSSDSGIATHIRRIAAERGHDSFVTDPLVERLPPPPRKTVAAKLQAVKDLGGSYDLIVLHRDADRDGRKPRLAEISAAARKVMPNVPHVPVIPIRMTEAWLLLDEAAIRRVAGAPNGKTPLNLPKASKVESVPDPKAVLKETLTRASGLTGRKLATFNGRFDRNRALLLERIDPEGAIQEMPSWRDFNTDLLTGLDCLLFPGRGRGQSSRSGSGSRTHVAICGVMAVIWRCVSQYQSARSGVGER